jgi:Leucine-rich repeat (LRR) protein
MRHVHVGSNQLTGGLPSWLDKYTNLRTLDLSANLMDGPLPTFLGSLLELQGLALDRNLFTSLEGVFDSSKVPGLRKLEQLFLEDNQFTESLDDNFLAEMKMLTYLDLSDNRLAGSIPSHLFEMQELVLLDLHDNDFTQFPELATVNNKLGLLALQKCGFANQPIPSGISNLRNLEHIDFSQNAFTGDMPSSIGTLKNLTYLFLAQNDFVPGEIPQWIGDLTLLEELSLKSTQRTGIIPTQLGSLSSLILLDLDNNQLTGTIPSALGSLIKLQALLLNRNDLSSAIPATFAQLIFLGK